jgi:hypothetical protein
MAAASSYARTETMTESGCRRTASLNVLKAPSDTKITVDEGHARELVYGDMHGEERVAW